MSSAVSSGTPVVTGPKGTGDTTKSMNATASANLAPTVRTPRASEEAQRVFTHASGIEIKLQNVVATMNMGIPYLDLSKIANQTRNAEYNPRRFAAVIMRIREPKSTALIFSSGKMVVTGAKGEEQAKRAAMR